MDSLVSRYSRPAHQNPDDLVAEEDEFDYNGSIPGLSHKFAMPPIAQVSFLCSLLSLSGQKSIHTN